MAGRTEPQAVKAFVKPIAKAVHCFTEDNLRPSGYKSTDGDLLLLLNEGEPSELRGCGLALELAHHFRIVEASGKLGPYKVQTTGYQYRISEAKTDEELYCFHWHPHSSRSDPHLHVPAADRRIHIPTGRIAIEQVLLLVEELGALPIESKWQAVVQDSFRRFRDFRTWP